jgi:hypothetical protein
MIEVKLTNYKDKCQHYKLWLKRQRNIPIVLYKYLEIIKRPSRYVIIKFLHHIPWTITNSNQNYRQGKFTAMKEETNQWSSFF